MADAFVAPATGPAALGKKQSDQTLNRVASYHFLVALDGGLRVHTGTGLAKYRLPGFNNDQSSPTGGAAASSAGTASGSGAQPPPSVRSAKGRGRAAIAKLEEDARVEKAVEAAVALAKDRCVGPKGDIPLMTCPQRGAPSLLP